MTALTFAHDRCRSSELVLYLADGARLPNVTHVGWEPFKPQTLKKYSDCQSLKNETDLAQDIGCLGDLSLVKHLWHQVRKIFHERILEAQEFDRTLLLHRCSLFNTALACFVAQGTNDWRSVKHEELIGPMHRRQVAREIESLGGSQIEYAQLVGEHTSNKVQTGVVGYEDLHGVHDHRQHQYATFGDIVSVLGFSFSKNLKKCLADRWLAPNKKHRSCNHYCSIIDNFNSLLEDFGSHNSYYPRCVEEIPESVIAARQRRATYIALSSW